MRNLTKESARKCFGIAAEWMYEQDVMNFPKSFNTNKQFKIKTFKNDTITFDVYEKGKNLGGFLIFVAPEISYDKLREGNETFAIKYYVKDICKDMYRFHLLQLN